MQFLRCDECRTEDNDLGDDTVLVGWYRVVSHSGDAVLAWDFCSAACFAEWAQRRREQLQENDDAHD